VSVGDLEGYATGIVSEGFAVLTVDFRQPGPSDGEPRQEIDPHRQVEDYCAAMTTNRSESGTPVTAVATPSSSQPLTAVFEASLRKSQPLAGGGRHS
jgi:hypothetical protein